ncbi:hypothetical protein EVAR_99169_1, partial [Eumeta japonica]
MTARAPMSLAKVQHAGAPRYALLYTHRARNMAKVGVSSSSPAYGDIAVAFRKGVHDM